MPVCETGGVERLNLERFCEKSSFFRKKKKKSVYSSTALLEEEKGTNTVLEFPSSFTCPGGGQV